MAMATGTFLANTSTGAQAISVGFQATTIMFWSSGTATGTLDGFNQSHMYFRGFTDGTGQAACAVSSRYGSTRGDVRRRSTNSACILWMSNGSSGAVQGQAAFSSFGATDVNISWSTAPATAVVINWMAWDCDADIVEIQTPTSPDEVSYSPSVAGDLAFSISNADAALDTSGPDGYTSAGACTPTEQFVSGFGDDNNNATATLTNRYQNGSSFVAVPFNDAMLMQGAATNMSSGDLTIDWTTVPGTARYAWVLVLDGIDADIVTGTEKATTGEQSPSCSVDPEMLYYQGFGRATDANVTNFARLSCGASDGTNDYLAWCDSRDGVATGDVRNYSSASYVYMAGAGHTTTVQANCSIVSLGSGGWTEQWDTTDAGDREYFALAMASPAAPPAGGDVNLLRGKFSGKLYGKVA